MVKLSELEDKIVFMDAESLRAVVSEAVKAATAKEEAEKELRTAGKRFVYGLRGIRELFHVSHPTAQRYKNTFLAPAIMQRGRKIVVDADLAMELYKNNANLTR